MAWNSPETGGGEAANSRGEFARNWRLLIACVAGCGFCIAGLATYSIGPFVKPLEASMGWSRAEVQAGTIFSYGLTAFGGIVAAFMIERFGMRRCAIFGLAGTGLGFLTASFANSLLGFYAAFGLAAALGSMGSFITWSRAITGAFDKRRGLALAVALSGTGFSGSLLPPILVWVIEHHGWRAGFVALACVPTLIALPLAFIFFRPVEQAAKAAGDRAANADLPGLSVGQSVRSYRFWVLLVSIVALYLGINGIIPNLIPSLTDDGHSAQKAALAQSAFALALVGGRLGVGYLVDRFWAPGIAAMVLTPSLIGCLILMTNPSIEMAILAAALVGMAAGAELDLLAFLTSRYFGIRNFPRVYSFLYAAVAASGSIAPFTFAKLYELTGSYDVSFGISAVLFALGGPVLLTLGRYPKFTVAAPVEMETGELAVAAGR
jgi:OFA family oxalate/formate antiporter-like MFS transporter